MPLNLKTKLTFRVPPELESDLLRLAGMEDSGRGVPFAQYVRTTLWAHVDAAKAAGRLPPLPAPPAKANGKPANARRK